MGFFSDKCERLVDPATGKALAGAELERAKQDPKAPRCRNRVPKAARFCNKCGSPAPGGWWRCPSCRKWIGNSSNYCAHCSQPLFPDDRAALAGGIWRKAGDTFAQRFEVGDVSRLLQNELQVQAGTVALLLDGGEFRGILEAGRHNPASLARSINWFGNPPPRSVVLVDSGDVVLPLCLEGLRSAEGFPLEFHGEVVLRFEGRDKAALAFLENRFKSASNLTYEQFAQVLLGEIRVAVGNLCTTSGIEDLVRDPERRLRLQDELTRVLEFSLARSGIELLHVSAAEFAGDQYEEFVEQNAGLVAKRKQVEYNQRLLELTARERMDTLKSGIDLVEYQELLAHEHEIASAKRDREAGQLRTGWERADELESLRHGIQVEQEQVTAEIGVKVRWDDYERDKGLKDAKVEVEIERLKFEQEKLETDWAMDLRIRKDTHKAEMADLDAKRRRGMSELEMLADVTDPEVRRDLLSALRLKTRAAQTPEQLLAEAAAESPAAADALLRMKERGESQYRELLEEMKRLYKDTADRQDKNLATMLEPAKEAAKREDKGGNQTIVR